ncbi:hypothetical protein EWM64_g4268 [Hericium alpestre]|uniref:BTB domain-containing protein n=1 Tax=Hericium alpestre TaxID=135208 RepID=A0A4Z0A201_9AGAM|nr:hypothetical protein EWM64_g4268 [Hericium alpestre]
MILSKSPNTFNDSPGADVIVRSGGEDPVDFLAHKCILSAASPFFMTMFSLPQAQQTPSLSPLPVIEMSEEAFILEPLLQFIYPIPDPPVSSLDTLVSLLCAATKYDMSGVISRLRELLVSPNFLRESPVRVFAIASRFELEEEAKRASQHTLHINVLDCPLSDDLKHVTAFSYYRLLDLHRRRAEAAQKLLVMGDGVKCMQCNGQGYTSFAAPKWWVEFKERAREELRVRPTTKVIFSLGFLAEVANASGCQRCAGSILASYTFLDALKARIDELPSTI